MVVSIDQSHLLWTAVPPMTVQRRSGFWSMQPKSRRAMGRRHRQGKRHAPTAALVIEGSLAAEIQKLLPTTLTSLASNSAKQEPSGTSLAWFRPSYKPNIQARSASFEVAPLSPFSTVSGEKVAVRPDEGVYVEIKFKKKPPHPALSPNSFATKCNRRTTTLTRK